MFKALNGFLACFVAIGFLVAASVARAGAAAGQWVVVVNGESDRSRTIANHYIHWRNIPQRNVIVLGEVPKGFDITIDDFKAKILLPITEQLKRRNLMTHVQGIAYSSDFPNAVTMGAEYAPSGKEAPYMATIGSLNGMTYLYQFVLNLGHAVELDNNWYAGREPRKLFDAPNGDNLSENSKDKKRFMAEKRFTSAAMILEEELAKYPDQFPVAYELAQCLAEAGQLSKSLEYLQRAIETGWTYGPYIVEDPHFKSLQEFDRFQTLIRGCEDDPFDWTPPVLFDARRFYAPNGVSTARTFPNSSSGVNYMLSMVLGACGGPEGNTEKEVLAQLKTSIDADFSHPTGKFFFTDTGDPRTECRKAGFDIAVKKLAQLGYQGEVIKGRIPTGETCLGVTMGEVEFNWSTSRSKLMPGALGDNLTSFGGVLQHADQVKLCEFIRHGAAAASGTVTEPYAVQAKFPHPTIHYYYAAGLTSAEAYYSSVTGPYQLLIAGDPLCQPFAKPPAFEIEGLEHGTQVGEGLNIKISVSKRPHAVRPFAIVLIVDGQLKTAQPYPRQGDQQHQIRIAGRNFETGAHEIRFIALDSTRIGTRYEKSYWVVAGEEYNQIKLSGPASHRSDSKDPLVVEIIGTDSDSLIEIRHDGEMVATLERAKNKCPVPIDKLGRGPVRLQAVATVGGKEISSLPITVMIE
jgi:tetratricopeptide (TPR) repeat protein